MPDRNEIRVVPVGDPDTGKEQWNVLWGDTLIAAAYPSKELAETWANGFIVGYENSETKWTRYLTGKGDRPTPRGSE